MEQTARDAANSTPDLPPDRPMATCGCSASPSGCCGGTGSSAVAATGTATEAPFEIWLVWSDRRLTVPPGVTTLQVLQEAGVPVDPGCLVGGCGSCVIEYVEGDITHKDTFLTRADREHVFCPCVSRATGVLVLPF